MLVAHEQFESGWLGLSIALREDEIDQLIERLRSLQALDIAHFHFRRDDFDAIPGVADVEISLRGETEPDNMMLE
jgi:hypothetical protein